MTAVGQILPQMGARVVDNRGMPTLSGTPETAPEGRRATRVVLADDDVLLREGLASLLDRSGFDVVGQAGNGPELLALVRSVQPVLLELDRETEEAAASLGANNWTIFTQVILPALLPSLLSGAGLAFSRAIGEFGSVVLIGGAVPGETEVSSQWIRTLIENDDRTGAAAISIVLLVISFLVLFILRAVGSRAAKREELAR